MQHDDLTRGVPLGFGMALAQNLTALEHFSALSQQQQQAVLARVHNISSKEEMRALVDSIGNGTMF